MRWIPVTEAQTENPKPRRTSAPEFLPLYLDNSTLAAPVSLLLFSSPHHKLIIILCYNLLLFVSDKVCDPATCVTNLILLVCSSTKVTL